MNLFEYAVMIVGFIIFGAYGLLAGAIWLGLRFRR